MKCLKNLRTVFVARVLVLFAFSPFLAEGQQNYFIYFPNIAEGTTASTIPFTASSVTPTDVRYQQVYDSAGFTDFGVSGPFLIHSIRFRRDVNAPYFFSQFPDFQIDLSLASRSVDGLSSNFADNIGGNRATLVPRGEFSIGVSFGSSDFAIIDLPTPYYYDPAQGNLLLDIHNFGGGSTIYGSPPFSGPAYVDAANVLGDRVSSVFANDVNAASGTLSTLGLVTQFWITPVPEPSTWSLLALALGTAILLRRRHRAHCDKSFRV